MTNAIRIGWADHEITQAVGYVHRLKRESEKRTALAKALAQACLDAALGTLRAEQIYVKFSHDGATWSRTAPEEIQLESAKE